MIGKVFGQLTVLSTEVIGKQRHCEVRCTCGTVKRSRADALLNGATVSCGCKKKLHGLKHGHRKIGSRDPTYQAWDGMVQRCTNPNVPKWSDYGGRGITVAREWLNFEGFLRDMGERPEGLTLERRDNSQGYSKQNCYWATRAEQALNKRSTVWVDAVCRGSSRSLTNGSAGPIRSYSETFGSSGKRVTLARLVSGISDCAKASIGEYFAPEFESQCGLFLREVV